MNSAFVVPDWANGVDQGPAMVESNVRTVPHHDGPVGMVAFWIALEQDEWGGDQRRERDESEGRLRPKENAG